MLGGTGTLVLFLGGEMPLASIQKSCVGWEHVDLNTFSGETCHSLLYKVSVSELESLAIY